MIGAKCNAPTFRVNEENSKAKDRYEIYWAEWDYSMLDPQPVSTMVSDADAAANKNYRRAFPRLDTDFEYIGAGASHQAGYPGYTLEESCIDGGLTWACFGNTPGPTNLAKLRNLPWGLGKPTTGRYSIEQGGWKLFGGQGQTSKSSDSPDAWVPKVSEVCEDRYVMILVINKEEHQNTFWNIPSNEHGLILDIKVDGMIASAVKKSASLIMIFAFSAFLLAYQY